MCQWRARHFHCPGRRGSGGIGQRRSRKQPEWSLVCYTPTWMFCRGGRGMWLANDDAERLHKPWTLVQTPGVRHLWNANGGLWHSPLGRRRWWQRTQAGEGHILSGAYLSIFWGGYVGHVDYMLIINSKYLSKTTSLLITAFDTLIQDLLLYSQLIREENVYE